MLWFPATAVEGLADLIEAETCAQARQALQQIDGALGRLRRVTGEVAVEDRLDRIFVLYRQVIGLAIVVAHDLLRGVDVQK